jgi:hypothetical protein
MGTCDILFVRKTARLTTTAQVALRVPDNWPDIRFGVCGGPFVSNIAPNTFLSKLSELNLLKVGADRR